MKRAEGYTATFPQHPPPTFPARVWRVTELTSADQHAQPIRPAVFQRPELRAQAATGTSLRRPGLALQARMLGRLAQAGRQHHEWSRRRTKLFVPINCAAIPNDLIESELFGYARGAFSGAVRDYDGLLMAAEGGSVFLDEIDDSSSIWSARRWKKRCGAPAATRPALRNCWAKSAGAQLKIQPARCAR